MKYFLLISMLASSICNTVNAQPGSLDPRFGEEGIIQRSFSFASRNPRLKPQKDGKLITSIFVFPDTLLLYRFNPDGSPDTDFADNGVSVTSISTATDLALQQNGKIVVSGNGATSTGYQFRRFLPTGQVDSVFGINGTKAGSFGGVSTFTTDIEIQDDDKIVTTGLFGEDVTGNYLFVARFMPDGSLDSSFGDENGKTRPQFLYGSCKLAFQKDGKIILAGSDRGAFSNDSRFLLVRFMPNGIIDSSFGESGTGIVKTDYDRDGDYISDIVIQPDDKMVVVGTALVGGFGNKIRYMAIARYLPNGVLDPDFGEGGKVKLKLAERTEGYGVDLQTNGKIVVCGTTSTSNAMYVLARYLSDGTPDTSFGENGIVLTDIDSNSVGSFLEVAYDLIIQQTGRIVIVGAPDLTLLGYEGDRPGIFTKIRRWIRRNILNFTDDNGGTASYYLIEQQNSGGGFMPVARIASNQRNNYSYDISNHTVANKNTYYRIKAVYADGGVAYSDAITASALQADAKVSISPNPASSIINISLKENKLQDGTIYIHDAMGNLVRSQSYAKQIKITMNISSLRQGHYRVVVNSNGNVAEGDFLKE